MSSTDISAIGKALEEKGVRYCLAAYVDMHGIPKCKTVPISHSSA